VESRGSEGHVLEAGVVESREVLGEVDVDSGSATVVMMRDWKYFIVVEIIRRVSLLIPR
jgi:hypothetical protein